ncbi:AMP-binding protein [Nibricoccus sp. IMCC34717]|uniref:AMP-binding protein n=1 Tax=Nibricoccus sp. IMCC34717 TaxID=3034021 RepID=UPI00384DC645
MTQPPNSILERLLSATDQQDKIFCRFRTRTGHKELSTRELLNGSRAMAALLKKRGLLPGEICFIILDQRPELLFSFIGAILVGAVPSIMPPLSPKQDPDRYWSSHATLFSMYGTRFLISQEKNRPAVSTHLGTSKIDMIAIEDLNPIDVAEVHCHNPIAFLQHSSGTTSLKKGVALTHASVLKQVGLYSNVLSLGPEDHIISWLPLYHDMGLISCLMLPLICGVTITYLDPFEWVARPALLFEAITNLKPTLCWQPNFAFAHLCRTVKADPKYNLTSIRGWINCSEPCKVRTVEDFASRYRTVGVRPEGLQVCYAMAETVFAVSQTKLGQSVTRLSLDSNAWKNGSVVPSNGMGIPVELLSTGAPLPEFQIKIVSPKRDELPNGSVGEIAISAPCLFSSYWKRDEETAKKLINGWYYTGDIGFMMNGELYVVGRTNDLLIVHGKNFYAHEIEDIANRTVGIHPGRAVAFGIFREDVGSEDVVVVAESDLEATLWPELASRLRQTILNEMGLQLLDAYITGPGWLVKTTSGKISREANSQKYQSATVDT